MGHYLEILQDTLGNNYVGINFDKQEILPYINQLQEILGDSFEQYHNLQQTRDKGKFHMTFISVMEYNEIAKITSLDQLQHLMKIDFDDIRFKGLGSAEKAGNKSYYIVLTSELLQEARMTLGLDEKDFHITLGFKWKDVHGVRKNEVMKPYNGFLRILSDSYQKEGDTFEFLKGIQNFDYDFFKLIEPIQINESNAIFRCGDNDYFQVSLVDDKLLITGKWQDTNKLPILAQTLVERKLKQIN